MKLNRSLVLAISSIFMITSAVAMSRHAPKGIDDALKQFNATKLEDFFICTKALEDIPGASSYELQEFFLANTRLLHHPKMRQALEQRLKKETHETLKIALDNYRTYAKKLSETIQQAYSDRLLSDVLLQAIHIEIAYYDLLLSTAVYHKEMMKYKYHAPSSHSSLFSCISSKFAIGISITLAGLLAYYGYKIYTEKEKAIPQK